MIPYCKDTGVGLIPWSPIARGALARPWGERSTLREETDKMLNTMIRSRETESDKMVINRVEEVAKKHGVSMTIVATAWCIGRGDSPIVGLSTKERIDEAVKASRWVLPEEDAKYLEEPYIPKVIQGY